MQIGILQTGFVPAPLVEKYGQYPAIFERMLAGYELQFDTFVVAENVFPTNVHSCDGWLITGSSDGAYEPHAYIPLLERFIREAFAAEVPLAGICFGHQIMAQSLGGVVAKYNQGWCFGQTRYEIDTKSVALLAMHQDQVVQKPAAAHVVASSDFYANPGLAYAGKRGIKALSFQPHPEFTPQYVRDLIAVALGNRFPRDQAVEAIESIADKNDSGRIAQQLAEFFIAANQAENK